MVLAAYLENCRRPFPDGVTPKEIDETLNKYGSSCDEIAIGSKPPVNEGSRPVRPITGRRHADKYTKPHPAPIVRFHTSW